MRAHLGWFAAAAVVALAGCSSRSELKSGGNEAGAAHKAAFTLFALAEVRGQIGPCGCTSDPLGDLSRTTQVIVDVRAAGPVLVVVDAGSLLFSQSPVPTVLASQEDLKADLLVRTYKDPLAVAALGLGPADLAEGPGSVRVPREVVNLAADSGIGTEPPKVIEVGGVHVGVFGVIATDAVPALAITDPDRGEQDGDRAAAQPRRGGRRRARAGREQARCGDAGARGRRDRLRDRGPRRRGARAGSRRARSRARRRRLACRAGESRPSHLADRRDDARTGAARRCDRHGRRRQARRG